MYTARAIIVAWLFDESKLRDACERMDNMRREMMVDNN